MTTPQPSPNTPFRPTNNSRDTRVSLPRISPGLLRLFSGYTRWYLRRHFHAVRLLEHPAPTVDDTTPLVVYLNHPSWWDPLIALLLARTRFPQRSLYAPIDARALRQYRFFARLGFFGVEQNSARGAAEFLRTSVAVLRQPGASLWLTPQGRFTDVRERPVRFRPGLGHLARRLDRAVFVPVAIEYAFWEERKPEALIGIGQPVLIEPDTAGQSDAETWTGRMETALQAALDGLGEMALRRDLSDWVSLLEGGSGVGLVYDTWRAVRARLRGERFHSGHGVQ